MRIECEGEGAGAQGLCPLKSLAISGSVGRLMMTPVEIAAEAAKLSEEERVALPARLLHGLESPVYWVSDEEVLSRMREADEDPSAMMTFDEFVFGLQCRHRDALDEARRAVANETAAFSDWEDAETHRSENAAEGLNSHGRVGSRSLVRFHPAGGRSAVASA